MKAEQTFTIKQTAEQTGISVDTIRYYEKIALLPQVKRKDNGHRIYQQKDINTIWLISCLKKTGMPLKKMAPFLEIAADANADFAQYPELVGLLKSHRENIISQISSLQKVVDYIDMKLEEGTYSQNCSEEIQDGASEKLGGEPESIPVSPVEMSYFPVSAKAEKPSASVKSD